MVEHEKLARFEKNKKLFRSLRSQVGYVCVSLTLSLACSFVVREHCTICCVLSFDVWPTGVLLEVNVANQNETREILFRICHCRIHFTGMILNKKTTDMCPPVCKILL